MADRTMIVPLASVLIPLTVIATALRLFAKLCNKAKGPKTMPLAADDIFAVLALIGFSAFIGLAFYANKLFSEMDLGTPQASVATISQFLKVFWATSLLAPLTITGAKFSILCLYYRLFSVDKAFRLALYWTGFFCLAWCIAAIVSIICTCIPISSAWIPVLPGLPPRPGSCFDYRWFIIGVEIPNCILDFWIVLMPIFEIRKLQLSLRIKFSILFMFLLAGWVGIFSLVRMIRIPHNASPVSPTIGLWITLQLGFAVICCNLPTYRPMLLYLNNLIPRSFAARASTPQSSFGFDRTPNSNRNQGHKNNFLDPRRSMYNGVSEYEGGRWSDGLRLTELSTKAIGGSDGVGDGSKCKERWPGSAIDATTTIEIV